MININIQKLQNIFTEITGLFFNITIIEPIIDPSTGKIKTNLIMEFRPEKPEYPYGFIFRVIYYWKRFEIRFIPDNYASQLIRDMEKNIEGRKKWNKTIKSVFSESDRLYIKINNQDVSPRNEDTWIDKWKTVEVWFEKYSGDLDILDSDKVEEEIITWCGKFFSTVLSLIPLEEENIGLFSKYEIKGYPEGALQTIIVNKYERNSQNRSLCISVNGVSCKVCGINFEKKYGEIGQNFIHIHHTTPISSIGEDYVIDPVNDLVPVCPNCHAMLHKKNPPFTIEELQKRLKL